MGKRKSMRERTRQQAEERATYGGGSTSVKLPDGIEFFSAEKGNIKLDFLPYEVSDKRHPANVPVGELWFERPFKVHRDVGIDQGRYVCPTSIGRPCPICEHMQQLKRSGDGDEDLIKDLRPKDRCLYNVREEGDDEIKVWDISYFLFTEFLDEEIRNADDEDDVAGFAELEDGKTLKIRFKEKTFGKSKYCETSRIDFLDRDDIDEDVLDDVVDLDACLVVKSYEELERIYYEMEGDDEDNRDDDDEPKKKKSRRKSSKKKEDDDDADKKSKKSRRRKSSKKKDDDDDADKKSKKSRRRKSSKKKDDDDDDEPKKSRRKSSKKKKEKESEDNDDECPFGHDFGDDCDETDDCEKCENWDACFDASEE